MKSARIIFHIDMNCFFASCERAEDPSLEDKPIAVAPYDPLHRGIILSPSYEARKYGIKTTMLVKEALLLCNELIVVQPKMDLYKKYSNSFFNYLYSITSNIEPASIDEGYLDVTDVCSNIHPLELAKKIQEDLLKKFKLPCSIGIGPNKFLAKMASNYKKPLGITVFRKREVNIYLWPLPVSKMYGIGKKTSPKLEAVGLTTIGDLANPKNLDLLKETVGQAMALSLYQRANGIDNSTLNIEETESSSVSNAHTFDHPIFDLTLLRDTLKVIANTVSHRLQKANQVAQTIGIIIKYPDLKQINRGRGLDKPVNDASSIYFIAEDILESLFEPGDQIRLIGIFANRLLPVYEEVHQISIFDDLNELEKVEEIQKILKDVKKNFGETTINLGYYEYKRKNE